MICVKIGNEEMPLDDASPGWITQQIESRRRDGVAVCVIVRIKASGLDMRLTTPGCARGGVGRPPNANERAIFNLWEKCGLNEIGFTPGQVVAFLAQVRHIL